MPRYHYRCERCEYEYRVRHSMGLTIEECPECGEDSLLRVLPHVRYENREKKVEVGSVVKSSIEEAKRAIKEEKKNTSKEYTP